MHPDLKTRRRVVILASQSYETADANWHEGLMLAAKIVPDVTGRGYWKVGNPGSRIRKLYEQRDQALQRLSVARLKLQVAKTRLLGRQEQSRSRLVTLLITRQQEFG